MNDGPQHLVGYRLRDYDHLVATLREAQRAKGAPSQRALGVMLGAHSSSVNEWLVGKTEPLAARLVALADALGYDLALVPRDADAPSAPVHSPQTASSTPMVVRPRVGTSEAAETISGGAA